MLAPSIFKANDIRGIVGAQWDVAGARALGAAYADTVDWDTIVMCRDMRVTGVELQDAFMEAVRAGGISVVDAGLASTDGLWFASGFLDLPGVQITASHNPPEYNGVKFCLRGAAPVDAAFLERLKARAMSIDEGQPAPVAESQGTYESRDTLPDYVRYLRNLVHVEDIRPLTIVVDAGNGMGGLTAPAVFSGLNINLVGLYLDLDGTFPNHQPNPLDPKNLEDARKAVVDNEADMGLVFDGDADRAFVIDELGNVVPPSAITAMIAVHELAREPGGTIIINTIVSQAVPDIVKAAGGHVVESRVGHTYVKALMAEHHAIFGGEHSAHFYFRDFFGADTGVLAGLHVIDALGHQDKPLSQLVAEYTRYATSGEINSTVADASLAMREVAASFAGEAEIRWGDGVKIVGDQWWVSLRPSNTEPLLRLNVEAPTQAEVDILRDRVLTMIRK